MIEVRTVDYVCIHEVIHHNKLDVTEVFQAINDSDVCYGTNADTFITAVRLENILGKKLDFCGLDNPFISLGG